jgi:hypothetical protein
MRGGRDNSPVSPGSQAHAVRNNGT